MFVTEKKFVSMSTRLSVERFQIISHSWEEGDFKPGAQNSYLMTGHFFWWEYQRGKSESLLLIQRGYQRNMQSAQKISRALPAKLKTFEGHIWLRALCCECIL